ncbi:MAG: hypothetical protein HYZ51_04365 [Candidatus Doudnabacteria bacterium]|nr:hypothetical protein [Candidatus Doudnabacteria bacterium]
MKIFSLETKKHLAGWSVGVSLILNMVILIASVVGSRVAHDSPVFVSTYYAKDFGFPFLLNIPTSVGEIVVESKFLSIDHFYFPNSFIWNFIFWVLVSLIVLNLVRRWKYRKAD